MRDARRPARSFGEVARRAVVSESWPSEWKIQARSLASILSKLNRGQELEWLADRPEAQVALADALGEPLASVRARLEAELGVVDAGLGRFRLDELRYARPLDLVREPLPPGIPAQVLQPGAWRCTWWEAAAGSGRSLVGRWLAARRLATHLVARRWQDAFERLPTTGAVFVELFEAPEPTLVAATPLRPGLCVAAPAPPPVEVADSWERVHSPAIAHELAALVAWIAERLPDDGHFEPRRALEWLREAERAGIVDSLDTAMGLAGLIDEVSVAEIEKRRLHFLAHRFVDHRLEEASQEAGLDRQWLRQSGFDALLGIFKRLLLDTETSWDTPRSEDAWLALVADEHRNFVDVEWLRASLERSGAPLSARELERTLRDLPPGAFRTVRAFERAGLLVESSDPHLLVPSPRWLGLAMLQRARDEIAAGSPFAWGEALLAREPSVSIYRSLRERMRADPTSVIEDLLEDTSDTEPAHAAAVEAALRAAGSLLLHGAELSSDHLEALWEEAMALALDLGDSHLAPRVEHPAAVSAEEIELGRSGWLLAALAVSEQLTRQLRGPAALQPWSSPCTPEALRAVLDDIADDLRAREPLDQDVLGRSAALSYRAWMLVAAGDDAPPLPWLAAAGALVEAIMQHRLSWDHVIALSEDRLLAHAVFSLARVAGQPPELIVSSLWAAWDGAGRPHPAATLLAPGGAFDREVWRAAPPALLAALLTVGEIDLGVLPWEQLSAEQWGAALGAEGVLACDAARLWQHIPAASLGEIIRSEDPSRLPPAALAQAWSRAPATVLERVGTLFGERRSEEALTLTALAPEQTTEQLVAVLTEHRRDASASSLAWLRRWLHARVRGRSQGWRDAYALLARLHRPLST